MLPLRFEGYGSSNRAIKGFCIVTQMLSGQVFESPYNLHPIQHKLSYS